MLQAASGVTIQTGLNRFTTGQAAHVKDFINYKQSVSLLSCLYEQNVHQYNTEYSAEQVEEGFISQVEVVLYLPAPSLIVYSVRRQQLHMSCCELEVFQSKVKFLNINISPFISVASVVLRRPEFKCFVAVEQIVLKCEFYTFKSPAVTN